MRALLFALAVAALATGCSTEEPAPQSPASPARTQARELAWSERFQEDGGTFTFRVDAFEVLPDGWRADVSVTNETRVRYSVGDPNATLQRVFGVMLFRTGELREVEQLNASGDLPGIRRAQRFSPALPLVLAPGGTWSGTISAAGSLAAGRWVRVVFGAFVPVGEPPAGFPEVLVWITDHAYRLR